MHSLPPDSVLFTDGQGSMVLNYYLCDDGMALPFTPEKASTKIALWPILRAHLDGRADGF